MQTIIVASDLSERSTEAIRRGVQLAAETGAKLKLLHVVDDAMPAEVAKQVQSGAEPVLAATLAAEAGDRDIDHEITAVIGDTVEVINEVSDRADADLLIVGLHRRRIFLDNIKETTMELVIRSSTRPVLLVARPADAPYARILGGVDLSKVCASALHKAQMIAPKAKITPFHAHEVSFRKEAERDYEIWQAGNRLPKDLSAPIFVEASAKDAIEDIFSEDDYDMLAIGAHTRSRANRYFLGGVAAGLIRKPPCDLLIGR